MKGFIKVTQADNQGAYININQIVKIGKIQNGCEILLSTSEKVEIKTPFDDVEKLIDNASSLQGI